MAEVHIPDDLYDRISTHVGESDFETADKYAAYILEEVMNQLEGGDASQVDDRGEVMDRLRDLGYLE